MGLLGASTTPRDPVAGLPLQVDGRSYANAAAKFWMSLLDELQESFSAADRLLLSAPGTGPMGRHLLHPERAILDGEALSDDSDGPEGMREILAELDVLGPPAGVRARLYGGEHTLLDTALPGDCLDAETFPYLIVWLLEWAQIPSERWNAPRIDGEMVAIGMKGHCRYAFAFCVTHRELSEGLLSREVHVVQAGTGWRGTAANVGGLPGGNTRGKERTPCA